MLKHSQGDDRISVMITLDLATHSIIDCRDQIDHNATGRTARRWAGQGRFDGVPLPEEQS